MTYTSVVDELRNDYTILDCIDLSEFDQRYERQLRARFDKIAWPHYKENERIVFIADRTLKRRFDDEPPDVLIEMQRHIHYYNIPHYFIIVVSNSESIEAELAYLQKKYYPQETQPIPHRWLA